MGMGGEVGYRGRRAKLYNVLEAFSCVQEGWWDKANHGRGVVQDGGESGVLWNRGRR